MGRIRGWLVVYVVVLAGLTVHALALTVASVIIAANPSLAGLTSFVPAPALAFYVVSNTVLIVYAVVLIELIRRGKRSAVVHNVVFHGLSVLALVAWHFLHMKSTVGVAIDVVPNIVMAAYILRSRRVRASLVT